MSRSRYISLFSGIGGLEHPDVSPELLCEADAESREVLKSRYPAVQIALHVEDVLKVPRTDFVVGGWPCQDLSIAGKQVGMAGTRSSLFGHMLRVAISAQAHTIIGENVPNLLSIHNGADFRALLSKLSEAGFRYIA